MYDVHFKHLLKCTSYIFAASPEPCPDPGSAVEAAAHQIYLVVSHCYFLHMYSNPNLDRVFKWLTQHISGTVPVTTKILDEYA